MTFNSTFGRVLSPTFQPNSQAAAAVNTWKPTDLSGCLLWWDFSDSSKLFTDAGTTQVSNDGDLIYQINDKSGNNNHGVQSTDTLRPAYKTNIQNGKSLARYNKDYLVFSSRLTTIRSVYWVFKCTDGLWFVLGDASTYNWHCSSGSPYYMAHSSFSSSYWRNGVNRINGSEITITSTIKPSSMSVMSSVCTGNMIAGNFSKDRTQTGREAIADLAELIIYSTAHDSSTTSTVETYLNNKWAIY